MSEKKVPAKKKIHCRCEKPGEGIEKGFKEGIAGG
jgi:hypothetical protein